MTQVCGVSHEYVRALVHAGLPAVVLGAMLYTAHAALNRVAKVGSDAIDAAWGWDDYFDGGDML